MMMHRALLIAALAFSSMLFAQVETDSGDIAGTVSASGVLLPGVKVLITDPARGTHREAVTDQDGSYRVARLPAAVYEIVFERNGQKIGTLADIEVRVGEVTRLVTVADEQRDPTAPIFQVDVASHQPVIEVERTQQSSSIEQQQIQNLPLNLRNFLDLAVLTPGVVPTANLPDDIDLRVASNPDSGFSFAGNNGRSNTFLLDGAENNYNSGGVRPSISQEAIQEFQVNRNSFTAEVGWATGGVVSIVSKSGSNDWHGSAFGFVRDRAFQARNYFDPAKSAFTRTQSGLSLGGPIRRDRTFFFAAFERLQRRETAFVPILRDRSAFTQLTPGQQQLVNFFQASGVPQLQGLAAALQAALTPANFPATTSLFAANSGAFPFSGDTNQFSLRVDHRFNDRHNLFVRGNLSTADIANSNFGSLIAVTRGRQTNAFDRTVTINDTVVITPSFLSQTLVSAGRYNLKIHPNEPNGPELNVAGYGFFGRDIFLPADAVEDHFLLNQTFTRFHGHHTFKFGAEINPVHNRSGASVAFGSRFDFAAAIPLSSLIDQAAGVPNTSVALASQLTALGQTALAANLFAPITALQSFDLGLPIFYQQSYGDPNWSGWFRRFGAFAEDSWKVTPNLTLDLGVRYQFEGKSKYFRPDYKNIAPRLGFAWTANRSRTLVVRGGYGMYYGTVNNSMAYLGEKFSSDISTVFVPITGFPGLAVTSVSLYQTLAAEGVIGKRPINAGDLAQFGIMPGRNLPFAIEFGIDKNFRDPVSHQASLEIEQAFGANTVSIAYNFNRGLHAPRSLDRNIYKAGVNAAGLPIFGFYNPLVLQNNVFESTANSTYHAMIMQFNRRFRSHFTLQAHYTWSKAMDDTTDFNSDYQPMDQTNARAEWALSAFHVGHRVVMNAVAESPFHAGRGESLRHNVLGDWVIAPIFQARSFQPFNILTGFDNLGDNHPDTKRPIGAGRNIGRGPAYYDADLRVSRRIPLGSESKRLEVIAEAFNITNHTNFKTLNNNVGALTLAQLPHPLTGHEGVTTSPLAFTSAYDPRQIQLALRFTF